MEGEVWGQDNKMQILVYPRSQNIEASMVKTMSAGKHCGCILNTDYTSQVVQRKIDPHADQKQVINFVWPK